MFSWNDLDKFFWTFFITFPIVAVIHAAGHAFFVFLFGGKGDLVIGRGKRLFSIGHIHFHFLYFLDSVCVYEAIDNDKRWKHALIYAGGLIFNIVTILVINYLVYKGVLPKDIFFYQMVYFSFYYLFFAILPVDYGKDNPSDGKAIYLVLKYGRTFKEFS